MHIERCDVHNCTAERPAVSASQVPVDGWRYVTEIVATASGTANPLSAFLGSMMQSGSMPSRVTRVVCPLHDGSTWPFAWKGEDAVRAPVTDGIPRDADGNIIELDDPAERQMQADVDYLRASFNAPPKI